MNSLNENSFPVAVDRAIDHALRLILVDAAGRKEPEEPTGSGTYYPINDIDDSEFFECSPNIKYWEIKKYLAYLDIRISLLESVAKAIEKSDAGSKLLEHIDQLKSLQATLQDNKPKNFMEKRKPFTEYLTPEQQKLVSLIDESQSLFEYLND